MRSHGASGCHCPLSAPSHLRASVSPPATEQGRHCCRFAPGQGRSWGTGNPAHSRQCWAPKNRKCQPCTWTCTGTCTKTCTRMYTKTPIRTCTGTCAATCTRTRTGNRTRPHPNPLDAPSSVISTPEPSRAPPAARLRPNKLISRAANMLKGSTVDAGRHRADSQKGWRGRSYMGALLAHPTHRDCPGGGAGPRTSVPLSVPTQLQSQDGTREAASAGDGMILWDHPNSASSTLGPPGSVGPLLCLGTDGDEQSERCC